MFLVLLYVMGLANDHTLRPDTPISKYHVSDVSILTCVSNYFPTKALFPYLTKYLPMCLYNSIHARHQCTHEMVLRYLIPIKYVQCLSTIIRLTAPSLLGHMTHPRSVSLVMISIFLKVGPSRYLLNISASLTDPEIQSILTA